MTRSLVPVALAGVLSVWLPGCVSAGDGRMPSLVGPTYAFTTLDGVAVPSGEGAPWISFAPGQVSGHSGCNSFGGMVEITDDRLAFGPMMGTKMACLDPVRATLEANLLQALGSRIVRYQLLDDGTLQLLDASGLLVAEAEVVAR